MYSAFRIWIWSIWCICFFFVPILFWTLTLTFSLRRWHSHWDIDVIAETLTLSLKHWHSRCLKHWHSRAWNITILAAWNIAILVRLCHSCWIIDRIFTETLDILRGAETKYTASLGFWQSLWMILWCSKKKVWHASCLKKLKERKNSYRLL